MLSPLLLVQGLATRRATPRLPEPSGERDGTKGDGPPLRVLIIGDSAAAGVGASHQDEALLGQIVSRLADEFEVTWSLRARTGNKTATVLELLDSQPAQRFDVAVTSLGVNDVTGLVGRGRWRRQQAELRATLKAKFGVDTLLVSGLPPLHGFPALPQPLRWILGARATQLNRDLERDIASDDSATFLDLRFTADTTLMASDGFHPGPGVYARWAERVAALVREKNQL
ncbi:MAG: SGNH/GDSL hydrolase family protein [Woeseiaceae bacterium]